VLKLYNLYAYKIFAFAIQSIIVCVLLCTSKISNAQNCPQNIDFENGNFDGWQCYTGSVAAVGGQNVITLSPSSPMGDRHAIISSFPSGGLDPFGNFPVNCPNGSGHSVKLGNNSGGGLAEGMSYEFVIPANANEYTLIYNYAVVFQDPNHKEYEQPRMEIEITNVTDGDLINCSSFSFFPFGTPLPGFILSATSQDNTPVYYKDWTAVSINLDGLAGKTIKLFFKTSDCTFRRHFGYAYIDVNSECSGRFEGASFCPDDSVVNLIAPYGYQGYTWFNSNFTQVLGNQQTLTFSPPPPTTTQVAVALTPYNGYGCLDTLYTDITNNLIVIADAGRDTVSCNHTPVRIGTTPRLGVNYSWSPSAGLSNPNIANPLALPDVTTTYTLTARSNGGGCLQTDIVKVEAVVFDDPMKLYGKANYCIGSGDSAVLEVNFADSIQWYKNNSPIIGAHGTRYIVTETGLYYATLFGAFGCTFTTAKQQINISSVPVSSFFTNNTKQCLFNNTFSFTNNSTNAVGSVNYEWQFGDGNTAISKNATHTYSKAGKYKVTLIATSNSICADSIEIDVTVLQNPIASFNAPPICINLPVQINNTTADTVGSTINYLWTFANGQTSTLKNPLAPIYTLPGSYNLSLFVSSTDCPQPGNTITKKIIIDRPKAAVRYPNEIGVINIPLDLSARPFGETAFWKPALFLDNANSYTPIFKGPIETEYTIDIKTTTGCVTTDTVLIKLVKEVAIYVPSAFTPNFDELNDVLKPTIFGIKKLNYFRIFNRWGELMFETRTNKVGWNGIYKSIKQPTQTLVWMLEVVMGDGSIYQKHGTSILLR
jgi:gliding motility-associated-like protein